MCLSEQKCTVNGNKSTCVLASDVSILQAMQGCQKRIWSIMRRVDDDPRDPQRRPDDVAHYQLRIYAIF